VQGHELIADALDRTAQTLERVMRDQPAEKLNHMPTPATNSIAWLAWHLTRTQDHHLSELAGQPQEWTHGGWHRRFGMPPDDQATGNGHTPEQVAAFKVSTADDLLAYHAAVLARSNAHLATLAPEDLDRVLDEPRWKPMPTVGVRLVSVVNDNAQHAGQMPTCGDCSMASVGSGSRTTAPAYTSEPSPPRRRYRVRGMARPGRQPASLAPWSCRTRPRPSRGYAGHRAGPP